MDEDRLKAAPNDSGDEVEQQESTEGNRRVYDPERYAPVRESVWKRFPSHPMRTFAIAFPRGTMFGPGGPSVRMRSGREAEGSVIRRNKVPGIRERLGISDRTWRRHIAECVEQYVAHRCRSGDIRLFTHAMPAVCPSCHEEIAYDRVPSSHRRPRSDRDRDGRFTVGQQLTAYPDSYGPSRGRNVAAAVAETWPRSSTDEPHRERSFRGMEVGRSLLQPSEEAVEVAEELREAVEKSRVAVIRNDGRGAPSDPDAWPCPECGAISGLGHSMRCMTGVRERFGSEAADAS